MNGKVFLGILAFIFFVTLLLLYEFFPLTSNNYEMSTPQERNFNIGVYAPGNMQFYSNMRFPDRKISYKISSFCSLSKKAEMESAFGIVENLTVLSFYPGGSDAEIFVSCQERDNIDSSGLFIAGEGGPTKIIQTDNFNIIQGGEILLVRTSECQTPNIPIHELFHVLGFVHSINEGNIMYNVSRCNQVIGEDIPRRINELYSVDSLPDLSFENATAFVHNRYVDINMSIRNNGLKDSEQAKIKIYTDDVLLKEIELNPLKVGYGRTISLGNIYSQERTIDVLKIVIESSFEEIDKKNNEVILEMKK
ncbi:Uncharacterised protein [uncultured archaeon]|nr:Uncharacterised protein [uncultured archaeon]